MKKMLLLFVFLAAVPAFAQVAPTDGKSSYDWATAVSATGALGSYVDQTLLPQVPRAVSIDWTVSGTAPSACTFRVEGSADGTSWFGLDATSPAADPVACTASNMVSIVDRPVRKIRVVIVTYTAGDGTTSVKFHYTAGGK